MQVFTTAADMIHDDPRPDAATSLGDMFAGGISTQVGTRMAPMPLSDESPLAEVLASHPLTFVYTLTDKTDGSQQTSWTWRPPVYAESKGGGILSAAEVDERRKSTHKALELMYETFFTQSGPAKLCKEAEIDAFGSGSSSNNKTNAALLLELGTRCGKEWSDNGTVQTWLSMLKQYRRNPAPFGPGR